MPVIEFIGLPGAGKTTLQRLLAEELVRRGGEFVGREELVRMLAVSGMRGILGRGAARRAATALYLAGLGGRAMGWRLKTGLFQGLFARLTRLPLRWLAEDRGLAKHALAHGLGPADSQVHCLDEGFAHHLAACAVWFGPKAWKLAHKAPYASDPRHLLVHVQVPAELALGRLKQRGRPKSWPESPGDGEIIAAFDRAIQRALALHAEAVATHTVNWNIPLDQSGDAVAGLADALLAIGKQA